MLTDIEIKRYIDGGGNRCPYCQSESIESSGGFNVDSLYADQRVKCLSCSSQWKDVYQLTSVDVC